MKTDKKERGVAYAFFDHSISMDELNEAIDGINGNSNAAGRVRYELHRQDSSKIELEAGLREVLDTPRDYRVMNNDLRREHPPESKPLSDHQYVLVAKSEEGHERTAEELSHAVNQLHLLHDNPRVFRGAIVHKSDKGSKYHIK